MSETIRILIVDDEPDIRTMCAKYLGAMGLDVHVAETPFLVAPLAKKVLPHVIVSDVMMPGFSGGELVKLINQLKLEMPPIVVFYSAMDEEGLAEIAGEFPGARYVSKGAGLKRLHQGIMEAYELNTGATLPPTQP